MSSLTRRRRVAEAIGVPFRLASGDELAVGEVLLGVSEAMVSATPS